MAFSKKHKSDKTNWDVIKDQDYKDTLRGRDVYNTQQLERGDLAPKTSMLGRDIANAIICILVVIILWFVVAAIQWLIGPKSIREYSLNPADAWTYMNEVYVNPDKPSDRLTPGEYADIMATYAMEKDSLEPVEDPGVRPSYRKAEEMYDFSTSDYRYHLKSDYVYLELPEKLSSLELEKFSKDWDEEVEEKYVEYDEKKAAYDDYIRRTTDPSTVYRHLDAWYYNLTTDESISIEEYNKLQKKYEQNLAGNKFIEDQLHVPVMPLNMSNFYAASEYDENKKPTVYRNKLDATAISADEYDRLCTEYEDAKKAYDEAYATHRQEYHPDNLSGKVSINFGFNFVRFIICLVFGGLMFLILREVFKRNLRAQNILSDTTDVNQYHEDQHIALPEEVQRAYDWFPDVGAHSAVSVSSMISHMALSNKGLKEVMLARRAEKDMKDDDGDIMYYKGEILCDKDGNPIAKKVPMIDEKFADALFEASGAPADVRVRYDATKIPYNPDGKNRDKLGSYKTVADLINDDWEFPLYEPQRPAGAYVVDTAPVNTMVLAITRAGKGQTVIEPTLDMWLREKRQNNIVVNDPKGELIVKNYVRATVRGYQVVQFNLINAMKTDIYNPLAMAADAAREGDNTKCAMYVENIAEVFFPLDGGEDPVWPNAANNAFKRAAYGLIDFYLEEEKAMRRFAERVHMDDKILEQKIDEMWGKVTLYNCYQLFVQLSSKKMKNPAAEFAAQVKAGKYNDLPDDEYQKLLEEAKAKSKLWDDRPEADLLTLYFAATDVLPRNSMRTLVANANNALKAMAGAEKMMASVYGIAITAMSFFTDPTISTLTSGTLNQNVDLGGLSFPRRMGVRFNSDYVQINHFVGMQAVWDAFEDKEFQIQLGKEFHHEDMVTREGWARYYFDGKFANEKAYIRLQIKNPASNSLIRTFYFEFQKNYQTSFDGRFYVKDPILGDKIIKNGILRELKKYRKKDGSIVYLEAKNTFKEKRILDFSAKGEFTDVETNAIISTMVRYSEKPKMVYLVTPPHLMKYAKLILILIKQLVDLNFDKSYMTKSNQKPLYKTRFMLDELGNLQSEGHGINGFATMLSIGLGQEQQFTLILQTLQQLKDVYGDSVDKIVQGNCLPMDALIATPTGFVQNRDIRVGNTVLTPFGKETKVDGVYPNGVKPVYRVTLRDGSSVEATDDHLWNIQRWKTSIAYTGKKTADGKREYVGTGKDGATAELVDEVITTEELKERVEKGENISLPIVTPVPYETRYLPVHPYVLGVILGDGVVAENGSVSASMMPEKAAAVLGRVKSLGYTVTDRKSYEGNTPAYGILGISKAMRDLGLAGVHSDTKFIPKDYLYGDVEQRFELLRGLMDTDGTISKTSEMEYCSASKHLAEDVQELIRSLGGRVSVNVKEDVWFTSPNQSEKKKAKPAYRLQNIRLKGMNPFMWDKKASRWSDERMGGGSPGNYGNRVVSVEYTRDTEVQCIHVEDEPHMYLTNDYIPTHNTSNIVFLKSTDDSMIETLSKMSGTRHRTYIDTKTVTQDTKALLKMMKNEGKISYTMTTKEEPVISYNAMAFIAERNSIVFRAGDAPIWNRNETILPMSWRLFKDTIIQPGKDYTLQTIPTLSTAMDFDVRKNQPNFQAMLEKRMQQANVAERAKKTYQEAYGYTDYEIERLDPDSYSDDIMDLIYSTLNPDEVKQAVEQGIATGKAAVPDPDLYEEMLDYVFGNTGKPNDKFTDSELGKDFDISTATENKEQAEAIASAEYSQQQASVLRYAKKTISRDMIVSAMGINHSLDVAIINAYMRLKDKMDHDEHFVVRRDSLCGSADGLVYIKLASKTEIKTEVEELNTRGKDGEQRVYIEKDLDEADHKVVMSYEVTDDFLRYLTTFDKAWPFADGLFDEEMYHEMQGVDMDNG